MGTAVKHPVPCQLLPDHEHHTTGLLALTDDVSSDLTVSNDRDTSSCHISDIRALWRSALRVPKSQKLQMMA